MAGIGGLRDRVAFHRLDTTTDAIGGRTSGYSGTAFLTVWGGFRPERASERTSSGRLEAEVAGVLRIRSSTASQAVTTADKAVINGDDYQVLAITNPDRRGAYLEMQVRRGGAV